MKIVFEPNHDEPTNPGAPRKKREPTTEQLQRAFFKRQLFELNMRILAAAAIIGLILGLVIWLFSRTTYPVHHCTLVC